MSYLRSYLVVSLALLALWKLALPFVQGGGSLSVAGGIGLLAEVGIAAMLLAAPHSVWGWVAGALFFLSSAVAFLSTPDVGCKCLGPVVVLPAARAILAFILLAHFSCGIVAVRRGEAGARAKNQEGKRTSTVVGAVLAATVIMSIGILGKARTNERIPQSSRPGIHALPPIILPADSASLGDGSIRQSMIDPGPEAWTLGEFKGRIRYQSGERPDSGFLRMAGSPTSDKEDCPVVRGAFPLPGSLGPPTVPECLFLDSAQFVQSPGSVSWSGEVLEVTLLDRTEVRFKVTDLAGRPVPGVSAGGNADLPFSRLRRASGSVAAPVSDEEGLISVRVPGPGAMRRIVFSKRRFAVEHFHRFRPRC